MCSSTDGNNNGVIEPTEILEENNYYPFGLKHQGYNDMTGNTASNYKYQYNGKELQEEMGLNLYDFGARNYDAAIGRWHSMDNLSELYFSNSSYAYALNTPIQALDPDGNLVIFINGNHFGEGATGYETWRKGKSSYNWQGTKDYWRSNGNSFDTSVMNYLGDNKSIYRDGAIGGMFGFSSDNPYKINTAKGRMNSGYAQGKKDAEIIIKNLARDKSTGEIIETIKIITHSMGGAYGKGYVKALKEYILTLTKDQQKQIKITLVADFDPFQAGSLNADPNIFTQQFSHIQKEGRQDSDGMGWLANERQRGLSDNNYYEDGKEAAHSIFTFFNDVEKLKQGIYEWDGSGWICKNCK